jgi:hypothetical protein
MSSARRPQGYVLLIVLAAVAVLSVLAAFVHTQTQNQLVMTTALKGQSVAASRATLGAEAYLAQYKSNFPQASVSLLPTFSSYTDALDGGVGSMLPDALVDYSPTYGNPSLPLDLSQGGGAQWCVDVWRLNRGANVQPWTVLEVFGYYGFRQNAALSTCSSLANSGAVVVSQLEVQLEQAAANSGAPGSPGPGGGTGSSGGF